MPAAGTAAAAAALAATVCCYHCAADYCLHVHASCEVLAAAAAAVLLTTAYTCTSLNEMAAPTQSTKRGAAPNIIPQRKARSLQALHGMMPAVNNLCQRLLPEASEAFADRLCVPITNLFA
jgi:hypothetical protein